MSYIGNAPISAAFLVDTFSGNGSTVAFTMTVAPANTSSIIIAVTGVVQDPSTYSVSGTTLTFSAAPPSGTSNISVRYLGIPANGVTTTAYRTVTNTTATSGQTSFTIPSYTVGYVDVYRNGVYLPTTDYTATTGTTVVLGTGATTGDTITTISFYVSSVLNAIPATAGSVAASYLAGGAARSNWGAGGILQVVTGTISTAVSSTTTTFADSGLTATITPSSSSSRILVTVTGLGYKTSGNAGNALTQNLVRNGTQVVLWNDLSLYTGTALDLSGFYALNYVDSPASTSALVYKIQFKNATASSTVYMSLNNTPSTITLTEIAG